MNTTPSIRTHAKISPVRKESAYDQFVLWFAMPPTERMKLGMETQQEFARINRVHETTLTAWKKLPDFQARVTQLRQTWGFEKSSEVIYGIYRAAVKGNPLSQKLWLQYFMGFTEKTETAVTNKVEVGVNDIRFLIDALPEPQRTQFHGYIREIVEFANAVKFARTVDDALWDEHAPEPVLGQADNDAQEPPRHGTDELAACHTPSVRSDLDNLTDGAASPSSYYHQGAAWWW